MNLKMSRPTVPRQSRVENENHNDREGLIQQNREEQEGHPAIELVSPGVAVPPTIGTKAKLCLITLGVSLAFSLLLVSVLAVVIYSPFVTGEQPALPEDTIFRIQQLEKRNEQLESRLEKMQTAQTEQQQDLQGRLNDTVDTLSSVQEKLDIVDQSIEQLSTFETSTTTQLNNLQNSLQSLSLSVNTIHSAQDSLGSAQNAMQQGLVSRIQQLQQRNEQLNNQLEQMQTAQTEQQQAIQARLSDTVDTHTLQEKLYSVNQSIEQLSRFKTRTTTQLNNFQNTLQSLSSSVNSMSSANTIMRQDLDRLQTVHFYRDCITQTEICTVSTTTYSYSRDYWRDCTTSSLTADESDTQNLVTDVRCEYSSADNLLESLTTVRRSGINVFCKCGITRLNNNGGHSRLSSFITGTCTLIVTTCPRSINLLN